MIDELRSMGLMRRNIVRALVSLGVFRFKPGVLCFQRAPFDFKLIAHGRVQCTF